MPVWLLYVLIILTVYRVTRLIIADTFPPIGVPRAKMLAWLVGEERGTTPHLGGFGRAIHYLFTCPWCMSVWVGGLGIWALDAWWQPIAAPAFLWAASSAITGLLCGLEDKLS